MLLAAAGALTRGASVRCRPSRSTAREQPHHRRLEQVPIGPRRANAPSRRRWSRSLCRASSPATTGPDRRFHPMTPGVLRTYGEEIIRPQTSRALPPGRGKRRHPRLRLGRSLASSRRPAAYAASGPNGLRAAKDRGASASRSRIRGRAATRGRAGDRQRRKRQSAVRRSRRPVNWPEAERQDCPLSGSVTRR